MVRSAFRNADLTRDKNKCRICGRPAVDAHHITDRTLMLFGGYVVENGISLDSECHILAEQFHLTGISHPGYSPDDLYRVIGSSYEKAVDVCKKFND